MAIDEYGNQLPNHVWSVSEVIEERRRREAEADEFVPDEGGRIDAEGFDMLRRHVAGESV